MGDEEDGGGARGWRETEGAAGGMNSHEIPSDSERSGKSRWNGRTKACLLSDLGELELIVGAV